MNNEYLESLEFTYSKKYELQNMLNNVMQERIKIKEAKKAISKQIELPFEQKFKFSILMQLYLFILHTMNPVMISSNYVLSVGELIVLATLAIENSNREDIKTNYRECLKNESYYKKTARDICIILNEINGKDVSVLTKEELDNLSSKISNFFKEVNYDISENEGKIKRLNK